MSSISGDESSGFIYTDVGTLFAGDEENPAAFTWDPSDGEQLLFCPGTYYLQLNIETDLKIKGLDDVILDGAGSASVISVQGSEVDVRIENVEITNGHGSGIFEENDWSGFGGGVYCLGKENTISVKDVAFTMNSAEGHGGGLSIMRCTTTIENSTFTYNRALYGGGLYIFDASVEVDNSIFEGNVVHQDWYDSTTDVTQNMIVGGTGGAIRIYNDTVLETESTEFNVSIKNSTIENNTAVNGGGVAILGESVYFENILVSNNFSHQSHEWGGAGGGIYWEPNDDFDTVSIHSSTFDGNISYQYGGAIQMYTIDYQDTQLPRNNLLTLQDVSISNNYALNGGGIMIWGGEIEINDSEIFQNEALNDGAGMYLYLSSGTMEDTIVSDNTSQAYSGAVINNGYLTCIGDTDTISGFHSNTSTNTDFDYSAVNIFQDSVFEGIGCDMGIQGTENDNSKHDLGISMQSWPLFDYNFYEQFIIDDDLDFYCDKDGCGIECNGMVPSMGDFDNDSDGHTICGGDCDDNDPLIHPEAIDELDEVDQNCNGLDGE